VETLQDALAHLADERLDTGLRRVPGQGSGLSTKYFFMLVGSTNTVKADRMLLRALTRIVGHAVSPLEARDLLSAAAAALRPEYPSTTAQGLDYVLWSSERRRA